jgi:hypothetical protein
MVCPPFAHWYSLLRLKDWGGLLVYKDVAERHMPPNGTKKAEFSWVQFVAWPIVVLVALFLFRDPIAKFIGRATDTEIKFNKDGISIQAKRSLRENPPDTDRKKDESFKQTLTPVATSAQPSPKDNV